MLAGNTSAAREDGRPSSTAAAIVRGRDVYGSILVIGKEIGYVDTPGKYTDHIERIIADTDILDVY